MKTLNHHLIISGILFSIVLFLWPIFMGMSQPQGSDAGQLNWVSQHLSLYKVQFFFAFLLSPAILYMMAAQLDRVPAGHWIARRIGWVFLGGYFVLNSIAYASQMILVPQLIRAGRFEHALIWYFGSSASVIYFLNQMGYCFWAIGVIVLFSPQAREKGMIRWISLVYLLSAVLSIFAFAGLILDNKALNSLTLPSGLALVPVGILTVLWGFREGRRKRID